MKIKSLRKHRCQNRYRTFSKTYFTIFFWPMSKAIFLISFFKSHWHCAYYLYQQMKAVNTACADISARLEEQLAENQKLTDELAAAYTALEAANKKAADLTSETEAMQQAIKNMNSEPEKVEQQPDEKPTPTQTSSSDVKWSDILTPHEMELKSSISEKIKKNKEQKNQARYDGPLSNTFFTI